LHVCPVRAFVALSEFFVTVSALPIHSPDVTAAAPARVCVRCEQLPTDASMSGDMYCWFPAPHVAGKARAILRGLGIDSASTVADGLKFRFCDSEREAVAGAIEAGLSTIEREDTRALLCAPDIAPTPHDLARVEPLSRLVVRVRSGWLLAMMQERRITSYFQPIVHANAPSEVYGHEALLRGVAADGTLVPPSRLFDTARGAGLMFQLDLAARRAAIATAASHALQGKLFVNFAPTAIYDPASCLRSTVAAIDTAGISRSDVVFEIVETERAHDPAHLRRILDYYRGAGFRIALDDVGSGYSSLNLIHLLRPDVLKLDMELVRGVDEDPYKARIAANLLDVATSLGIDALAEGIETQGELEWVREHGAKFVQGYLIAKPAAAPRRA
jgi:EAL domain-containing protein (putative c-di-GMP-specific phosphodiesterase class I)